MVKVRSVPNPKCKHGLEVTFQYALKEDGGLEFPMKLLWLQHPDGKSCDLFKSEPRAREVKLPKTTYAGTVSRVEEKLARAK